MTRTVFAVNSYLTLYLNERSYRFFSTQRFRLFDNVVELRYAERRDNVVHIFVGWRKS